MYLYKTLYISFSASVRVLYYNYFNGIITRIVAALYILYSQQLKMVTHYTRKGTYDKVKGLGVGWVGSGVHKYTHTHDGVKLQYLTATDNYPTH